MAKRRLRMHRVQHEITKANYAQAVLISLDALRRALSARYEPQTVKEITKTALDEIVKLIK